MAEGNDILRPLYGVYFNSYTLVNENEVKKDFLKYGRVFNVKQISSRVFVNFTSKDDAERLIQAGPHIKYGEILKGRYGPKEFRDSDTYAPKNLPRKSIKPYGHQMRNSSPINENVDNFDDEYGKYNSNDFKTNGTRNDNDRKNSPKQAKATDHNKSSCSDKICNLSKTSADFWDSPSASGNNLLPNNSSHCHQENIRTPLSDNDELPDLVSVFHYNRLPTDKSSSEDCPPPLISAHSSKSCESSKDHRHFLIHGNSANTSHSDFTNGIHSQNISSRSTEIPPLINAEGIHSSSSIDFEEEPYCNQVLIANVPKDTTIDEIEKVLYPLEPAHIFDLDITNINYKIYFFHVIFNSENDAAMAAKQFDGLKLRGYDLTVKTLNDLILLTQMSMVK